jgi:pimeloyl-ACP methyl ester carboxylesterase
MALPFLLPLIENTAAAADAATATHMTNLVVHYGFREETHDISGVKIHCVVKDAAADAAADAADPSGVLVFIHGTASSSATFFDTMKALPPTMKCVAIDLPTFGISGHIDIERYSTNEQLCIAYADVIGHTLHQLEIVHETILVAHSLGGFLSIYVADRFPIKKLVMLNPAGILPTLGEYGYYWAIFFKTGLPTKVFQLPMVSSEVLVRLGRMVFSDGGIKTDFWLSFFANPNNEGHRILQRLITLKPFYSYWNTPAIMTLMDVYRKVPTSVCFGVDDTICPSHIGAFLSTLTRGEIMIHNIENANHNPCVNTGCMVKILVDTYDGNAPKREKSWRKVAADNNKRKSRNSRGYSYPLLGKTQESFQNVYDYIITTT